MPCENVMEKLSEDIALKQETKEKTSYKFVDSVPDMY